VSRSTKQQKKSKEADVSLEAHEPTSSLDDVSDHTKDFFPFPYVYLCIFALPGTDEEIRCLGY
jgi:hypothetical protein